jgi:hypothetical protein
MVIVKENSDFKKGLDSFFKGQTVKVYRDMKDGFGVAITTRAIELGISKLGYTSVPFKLFWRMTLEKI